MTFFDKTAQRLLYLGILIFASLCRAENFYIAETSLGRDTGADAADAHSVAFFNNGGNWSSPTKVAGKIGPGDTVHLTGTITSGLQIYVSGTAGNVITVLFDPGANMTAPVFAAQNNGAIFIFEANYITIDGGATGIIGGPHGNPALANGIIQCTANGSGMANQVPISGIFGADASYLTVKNLVIANLYVHTDPLDLSGGGSGVADQGENKDGMTGVTVTNCIIHDTSTAIGVDFGGACSNYTFTENTAYNCNWAVGNGDRHANSSLSGLVISGNLFYNWSNWNTASDAYHHNGVMLFIDTAGSTITSPLIYGNTFGPGWGSANQTAGVFFDTNAGGITNSLIYNNLFLANAGETSSNGYIAMGGLGQTTTGIYNNTFINNATTLVIDVSPSAGETVNICNNLEVGNGTQVFVAVFNNPGATFNIDHNLDYNPGQYSFSSNGNGNFYSLGQWTGTLGFDVHGTTGSPNLNGSYVPQSPSAAIGAGANLSNIFSTDVTGATRPASWDIGAYNSASGAPSAPAITSAGSVSTSKNQPFSYSITASNSPTGYNATGLPAGLTVNTTTGLISGTPTVSGLYNVTLSATNTSGTGTGTLNLTVASLPPGITSSTIVSTSENQPFSYSITASNSPTGYNATGLPAGLTVNTTTGLISGTPTVSGLYSVTLSATNTSGTGTGTLNLTVASLPPGITSSTSVSMSKNQPFSYSITASNSPTGYNATGLPAGLTVNTTTGLISGTPTVSGLYSVTLSATNTSGTGTATLLLTVASLPPIIASTASASTSENQPFSYSIAASNSPTGYNAIGLPAGLTVNTTTGLISGTPTVNGLYSVTLSATNTSGTGTGTLNLTIGSLAPVITSATSVMANENQSFSYAIIASNSPFLFSTSGLPAGLSANISNGVISGTPTTAGSFSITLSATNSNGTATAVLALTIASAPGMSPVITSASSATATAGSAFSYSIVASNLPTSYNANGLPGGLSVNASTGLISGTATQAGSFTIGLTATNASGSGTAALVLTVTGQTATPAITSATDAIATENIPFSYSIVATNSPTNYSAAGLPSGLSINTFTGLISGTPTVSGAFSINLNAMNGSGSASATLDLAISQTAPAIYSATVASATVNAPFSYSILASGSPTRFSASGLPTGLTVNTANGAITGTATTAGTWSATISGTNSWGTGSAGLQITVSAATSAASLGGVPPPNIGIPAPVITSATTVVATLDNTYSPFYTITASNSPTSFSASGLPPGLTLSAGSGVISGVPLSEGTYIVGINATNATGTGSAALVVIVQQVAFSGVYFGTFSNGGNWALYVNANGTGTFIADVGGTPVAQTVTVNSNGTFSTSSANASSASTSGLHAEAVGLAPTIAGQIHNGAVSGTLGTTALNGFQDMGTSQAAQAGYYQGSALMGSSGSSFAIVGGDGQVLVVAVNGATAVTSSGKLSKTGTFSGTTTDGGALSLTVTAQGQATTNLTPSGSSITVNYLGLSDGVTPTTRLTNLSARALSGTGSNLLTVGFVVSGGQKSMLVRGIGPALAGFGLTNVLANPDLSLFNGSSIVQSNEGWGGGAALANAFTQVGAFSLASNSKDGAILATLAASAYTAQVAGASGSSGVALAEIYDADTSPAPVGRLVNISARANVGSGGGVLVAGFIISGNAPEKVLIRGVGPTLTQFGVVGALASPQLTLFDSNQNKLDTNTAWGGSAALANTFVQVGAFALGNNSNDTALLVTLSPGAYSAQVSGANGTTGIAMIEVYEVP